MALQLDSKESKWWYGRIVVNGRKLKRNLGVEVRGERPRKLRQRGDDAFERSRAKAQAALERLQLDIRKRTTAEELVQTIHEIRTGGRIRTILLEDCAAHWEKLPRRRPLAERYLCQAQSRIASFIKYLQRNFPGVREMANVQSHLARDFVNSETKRGISPKTYNSILILLRSVFESLRKDAGMPENPFEGIPTRETQAVFRKPFTAEELRDIIAAAKADPFIYPAIVTAICTAMRRGDCCMLLQEAVDLPTRFIRVKTSKTSEVVQIPIFPMLYDVLKRALASEEAKDSIYVFPKLSMQYRVNPDHVTDRVRRVMRAAGFFNPEDAKSDEEKGTSRGAIQQVRKDGLRRASIRDFHSFRVTWVTLALTAGVPLEIVKKVTGHRTAEIVMKHYFQPGQEDFRRTLASKLPAMLSGSIELKPVEPEELIAKFKAMTEETWQSIRDELLHRLAPEEALELVPV
jgi:site-specific recombinase XerC